MRCVGFFQLYFQEYKVREPTQGLLGAGPAWDIATRNETKLIQQTALALKAVVFTRGHFDISFFLELNMSLTYI